MSRHKWKNPNTGKWRIRAAGSLSFPSLGTTWSTESTNFLLSTDQQPRWSHVELEWGLPKPHIAHCVFFPIHSSHSQGNSFNFVLTANQRRGLTAFHHKLISSCLAFRDCLLLFVFFDCPSSSYSAAWIPCTSKLTLFPSLPSPLKILFIQTFFLLS